MTESHEQRLCMDCKKWIDARASQCYLCGGTGSEENAALKRSVELAQLNGALSRQVGFANAEARAEAQFKQAHRTGNADLANRPLSGIPGYSGLVGSIKQKLQESGFGE
jgi:hypothetical protein